MLVTVFSTLKAALVNIRRHIADYDECLKYLGTSRDAFHDLSPDEMDSLGYDVAIPGIDELEEFSNSDHTGTITELCHNWKCALYDILWASERKMYLPDFLPEQLVSAPIVVNFNRLNPKNQ